MPVKRRISRCLAIAGAITLAGATASGAVAAFPRGHATAEIHHGLRITGLITWEQYTPAIVLFSGQGGTGGSGGDTQAGSFNIDAVSTAPPNTWA